MEEKKSTGKKKAIVLIGHGSRAMGADDDMEKITVWLQERFGGIVEACRLEGRGVPFAEAFEKCVAKGAEEVLVIPYFLHFGVHLRKDIPEMMRESARKHPDIRLVLGKHLGYDDSLLAIIAKRIEESEESCDIRDLPAAPIDQRPDA